MNHRNANLLSILLLGAVSLLALPVSAMPQGWDVSDSSGVGISFEYGSFRAVGAVSVEFTPGWYRDKAIQRGDRYLSLNGQLLPRGLADWRRVWREAAPGEIVAVLFRDGACQRMWFHKHSERELRAMPSYQRQAMERSPIDLAWLESARAHVRRVRVAMAIPGTRAALAGLEPGDVVESVGGDSNAQFSADWALDRLLERPGHETPVTVRRDGDRVHHVRVPTENAHRQLVQQRNLHACTVANATPFAVQVVIMQEHLEPDRRMSPWYRIEPGESYQRTMLHARGSAAEPRYKVYARTVDADRPLLEWLYRGGALPVGAEAILQWPDASDESAVSAIAWVSDTSQPASPSAPPSDAYEAPFMDLHVDPRRPRQHAAVLTLPPGLGFPGLASSAESPRTLAAKMVHARLAAEAMRRQLATDRFLARYGLAPFHLGLEFDPKDDPTELGVLITGAAGILPRGDAMQILPGDRVISFGGRPVFNGRCVLGLAREHGVNIEKGIDKPIAFVVQRPGRSSPLRGATSYWFVREFWEGLSGRKSTASSAVFQSGLDAVLFGFGENLVGAVTSMKTGLTYKESVWRARQSAEMARQWHSAAYASAEIGALFFSLPRAVIKKIAPRAMAREAGSTLGRVGYECFEQVVFSLRRGSPMRTSEQLQQELMWTIPIAAAGAVVPGVLGRRLR